MTKNLRLLLGRNPLLSLSRRSSQFTGPKAGEKSILRFQDQHEGSRMGAGPASGSTSQDSDHGQAIRKVSKPDDEIGGRRNSPHGLVTICEKPSTGTSENSEVRYIESPKYIWGNTGTPGLVNFLLPAPHPASYW